ncbi:MAG: hypothetical protein J5806_11300 [Lentisphaeria bacterium]|nr:hypothetical protein [Lentisphaeria bacterium]
MKDLDQLHVKSKTEKKIKNEIHASKKESRTVSGKVRFSLRIGLIVLIAAAALVLSACCHSPSGGGSSAPAGFVHISDVVPDAILEIRYYSTYNFDC